MTTEKLEEKKFVLNKEELVQYHNRLLEHPDVKLVDRVINGQHILEDASNIRKLLEENVEEKKEDGVEDGKKRPNDL